ncbi:MAG TPA: aminotransferase class V-fold PLP-dependent enzyme [Acidobacteriaceae bacterium]|nr:aminotransferase class V-fold PLP-dependent enzyme [Acidobacteriaceae bacterium]
MYEHIPDLLDHLPRHARSWFQNLATRPVRATATSDQLRETLGGPLPEEATAPATVIDALANAGATGTVASAGPRYFGFVVGGSLPAALAADWLVSTWDQNAGIFALSPLASTIEQITGSWLREIAGLSSTMSFGFVTGGHMANFTSLACARHSVLRKVGWDVEANGLFGAPPVEVYVNEESHYTIFVALRLLGLGGNRVHKISADEQGRMRADLLADSLRETSGPAIVCAQAGNVNTGAFDPIPAIADAAKERSAWLHVDGAFGLWAAASPHHAHLVRGIERADSVATDAHKWLNVPYDCGLIFCADEAAHRTAMSLAAAYIVATSTERDPHEFVPEESRRARAIPVYAALRSLGRRGLAAMIERNCRQARRFGEALRAAGFEILNDVVLNQVLVSFGTPEQTQATIAAVQNDGTCWCGGTVWKGRTAMRISVSNWSTTDEDVERSIEAIIRCARIG